MKPVKYLSSALFIGSLLFWVSPAACTTPSLTPSDATSAVIEQSVEDQAAKAAYQETKKRAEYAKTIVAARVGGSDISYFDVIQKMNDIVNKKFPGGVPDLPTETTLAIRQEALDNLVMDQLAVNYAVNKGLVVPDEKIDDVIAKLKKAYEGGDGFNDYLKEKGVTEEDLRARIRDSRLLQRVTKQEIYGKVKVDPDDLQKIYDEYKADGKLKKRDVYIVKDLLMLDSPFPEETRKKAEMLLGKIKADDDNMGKLIMDGSFITRRLQVQEQKYPQMHKLIDKMEVGQLSGVVEDGGKFHIFKVVERHPSRDLTMAEAKGFLENRLVYQAQEDRKDAWHEELRSSDKVEILLDEVEAKLLEQE